MTDNGEIILHKELYSFAEIQRMAGIQAQTLKNLLGRHIEVSLRRFRINGTSYFRRTKVYGVLKDLGFDAETIIKRVVAKEKTIKEYATDNPHDGSQGKQMDYLGAPILHNEFYTIREMANATGMSISVMRSFINCRIELNIKKRIINNIVHYDRDTTLEILWKVKRKADRRRLCEEINEKRIRRQKRKNHGQ